MCDVRNEGKTLSKKQNKELAKHDKDELSKAKDFYAKQR
jgi:hypothetical protein